jgi:hypothetical protein
LSGLPGRARQVLARALVFEVPVPFEAVAALFPDQAVEDVRGGVEAAAALGLIEQEPDETTFVYRVPRLLGPLLDLDRPQDLSALTVAAAQALHRLWWKNEHEITEPQALELIRLARNARLAAPDYSC